MLEIGLAGRKWAFLAAYNGLVSKFNKIYLLSTELDSNFVPRSQDVVVSSFDEIPCQHILLAGYHALVTSQELTRHAFANIHLSLLPRFRGMDSTAWAIISDEKQLGYTIHVVDQYIDNGDIIYQFSKNNNFESSMYYYYQCFFENLTETIAQTMESWITGELIPTPQIKEQATWNGKRSFSDECFNFFQPIQWLRNLTRIQTLPLNLPHVWYQEKLFFIAKWYHAPRYSFTQIGRIVNIDDEGIWVGGLGGYYVLQKLLQKNGEHVKANQFTIGHYFNNLSNSSCK